MRFSYSEVTLLDTTVVAAARAAVKKFGAIMDQGEGLQGQSYAILTAGVGLGWIRHAVNRFIEFATANPDKIKTAYEWIFANQQLAMVNQEHIDWESMEGLSEEAWPQLRVYSFSYPSFIHCYHNGIAEVQWQLVPDGRYWMDDDGYGMTSDIELNIYGFIDQEANIISKFHYYTNTELETHILDKIRKDAENELNNIKRTR